MFTSRLTILHLLCEYTPDKKIINHLFLSLLIKAFTLFFHDKPPPLLLNTMKNDSPHDLT